MKKIDRLLLDKKAEGYIDVAVMVLCVMLLVSFGVKLFPVFAVKQQIDNFADELLREAEIAGQVGAETDRRLEVLTEKTGLSPAVTWSDTGRIQLNDEITVTVSLEYDIGLFGLFGSFPVTLTAKASGKSEVYWK